ncbi:MULTISPECIES: DegT/DnrJ/EryC1/StrS aminotransferase family protein [unclassified Frankia]|uniref:DegT/DnrJ/EryC1/StrS family aminotransferase n=1 Tax=unclassified Frankia TaxID=2632575 RepID=UPI001EF4BF7A|nr:MULTISPECIES: DegT/DnrJ/EryC1/StrS family aminotransferase [unclassified Frankia]
MTTIPLVDLAAAQAEIAEEVRAGFDEVLATTAFVGGKQVAAFEREYADFCGVGYCVGVGNGTDAIELALRAAGVGAGTGTGTRAATGDNVGADEVILPVNTFVATAEAVLRAGALPVFADVDDEHLLLDPDAVGAALTERTRAVIPVHLYGQAAPVERIAAACRADTIVLEDAAQAQGAVRDGQAAGGLGLLAATSFYPGKNLGAAGDAGAVLTNDAELARKVRLLGAHGSERKYVHESLGFNSRLDTLQAVVLRAKLTRLARWNEARAAAAVRYDELLGDDPRVRLPATLPGNIHVWHLYVVRIPDRDAVLARLHEQGVGAGIHYPVPLHLQPAFAGLGHAAGDFPVAEKAAGEILSLPLYPHITPEQQRRVADELRRALP